MEVEWATIVGHGDCCSTIKPTTVKSVNSSYVVSPIVVSWPWDSIKISLKMLVIPSSPKWEWGKGNKMIESSSRCIVRVKGVDSLVATTLLNQSLGDDSSPSSKNWLSPFT